MARGTWPDRRKYENAVQAGARSRSTPADGVQPEQYQRGWELISTGHTTAQILTATGMTRPQLEYLTRYGYNGQASYVSRLAEISQRLRQRAMDAADEIGAGALDALRREIEMSKVASTLAAHMIKAHVQAVVIPAQRQLAGGGLTQEESEALVAKMAPPDRVLAALRTLRDYTRLESTARMFRTVFDSPLASPLDGDRARAIQLDLGAERSLPAAYTVVEDVVDSAAGAQTDPLDLLPEWAGWSLEDIEHYALTGVMPDEAYGDDRGDAELPDECLDQSADDG